MTSTRRPANRWSRLRARIPATATPLAFVFAAIAVALGNHPTGLTAADPVVTFVFVWLVVMAGARARRWAWLVISAVAVVVTGPLLGVVVAAVAVAGATTSVVRDLRPPALGAAVGGLSILAMLSGTDLSATTASIVSSAAVAALLFSAYRASRSMRERARQVAFAFVVISATIGAGYAVALAQSRPAVDRGLAAVNDALAAGHLGDTAAAAHHFDEAANSLRSADDTLGQWWAVPARLVPGIGPNVEALSALVETAVTLSNQAATTSRATDLSRVKLADGRLDLASVSALRAPLGRAVKAVDLSESRLRGIRTSWLVSPVRSRLRTARELMGRAGPTAHLARDAVATLPDALGGSIPKHYFVAFVTPAEARGRTGFIGNFAELEASDGKLSMTRFGRTADLQTQGVALDQRTLTGPKDYLRRYERFDPASTWQNVTMAADFPSVAEVVRQLYPQSGGRQIDGVISLDPVGLAALLQFTGPVSVPGVAAPLTAATAAQFLLRDQYITLPDTAARVDTLEVLARTSFTRLGHLTLKSPRALITSLGAAVGGGHIRVESFDAAARRAAHRAGLRGELVRRGGNDFLAVTSSNLGGSKIDVFLRREIDYRVNIDPHSGQLHGTITLTLHNDAPASGLPAYIIGNSIKPVLPGAARVPSGVNRLFLSVYTPWTIRHLTVDGKAKTPEVGRERGLNVASTVLEIGPGAARNVTLEVTGGLKDPCDAGLDVASQPLPIPDEFRVGRNATSAAKPPELAVLDRDRVSFVISPAHSFCR